MDALAEILPSLSKSTALSISESKPSSQAMRQKVELLRNLVKQSYNSFNIYGVTPDQLTDKIQAFALVLEDQDSVDIQSAFKEWLKEKPAMPAPSDIRGLSMAHARHRREMANATRARPANPHQPERPTWIAEFKAGRVLPDTLKEFREFLSKLPESTGRAYCENLCNYDDVMKTE